MLPRLLLFSNLSFLLSVSFIVFVFVVEEGKPLDEEDSLITSKFEPQRRETLPAESPVGARVRGASVDEGDGKLWAAGVTKGKQWIREQEGGQGGYERLEEEEEGAREMME